MEMNYAYAHADNGSLGHHGNDRPLQAEILGGEMSLYRKTLKHLVDVVGIPQDGSGDDVRIGARSSGRRSRSDGAILSNDCSGGSESAGNDGPCVLHVVDVDD